MMMYHHDFIKIINTGCRNKTASHGGCELGCLWIWNTTNKTSLFGRPKL